MLPGYDGGLWGIRSEVWKVHQGERELQEIMGAAGSGNIRREGVEDIVFW